MLPLNVKPTLSFGEAVSNCFNKYATFTGRARRSEYWWFGLLAMLIVFAMEFTLFAAFAAMGSDSTAATVLMVACGFFTLAYLAIILPSLAVFFRRLHDTGHSGWYWFLSFIPIVGSIILLVWCCQDSDPRPNQYGPSPKYSDVFEDMQ